MKQLQVNSMVATIIGAHIGRKNAIQFKDIAAALVPAGATITQIREAIRVLRCHRKAISSRPNVGYYIDKPEMKGCKTWIEHLRAAKSISPVTPNSLKWV